MIDYETQIFNTLWPTVAPLCAPEKFVSKQVVSLTAFPAVSLYEMDNITVRSRQSSTPTENLARITYQMDVYAKTKRECRNVFSAADGCMIAMNFARVSGRYIDNPANPDIFRYTARYEAEIDPDGNIYRRS